MIKPNQKKVRSNNEDKKECKKSNHDLKFEQMGFRHPSCLAMALEKINKQIS